MEQRTYTLREVARELGLPESTVRYYRDAFALYIPTVGLGRRRRYPEDALDVFRIIAHGFAQNMAREDIEARIQHGEPRVSSQAVTQAAPMRVHRRTPDSGTPTEELVSTIMDSERERRDVMWQLAREIVRMGEVLERQQMTLVQITQHLDWGANRALPPGQDLSPVPYSGMTPAQPPVPDEGSLARELGALREELQRERELVERLRRSKLEIERRATVAEAELERRAESPDVSALRRFLGKEQR
ncbi:MAG: MerR family transcriptional regulator [Gemmatimonadetes bacterium]|nr:MerR family transcriptional regulator [Gemmatimonadota bacterium]